MTRALLIVALMLMSASVAHAACSSSPFNPLTKIRWSCIFPITIGGVKIGGADALAKKLDQTSAASPLCVCTHGLEVTLGLKISFWEPNRMIDVVSEPYCMMALGIDLGGTAGHLSGSTSSISDGATNSRKMFAQMHYYISPVWAMLDLFTDLPCFKDKGFDVALITEVLPTWQSEALGAIIQPEGVLFGNPAAGLACMADSASSAVGLPIEPLFWCMGSWGSTYPIGGDIHFDDSVEAWAGIAARSIFMMGRLGLLRISSNDGCSWTPTPIWRKDRYKLQILEPVKGGACVNIGRSGATWSHAKHAPGHDNSEWAVFEKNICCAGVSFP